MTRQVDVYDFRWDSVPLTPEQYLWVRVLHGVVRDALGNPLGASPGSIDDEIHKARIWLCFGPDLGAVAAYAGFDGDTIRAWAHRQRADGWPTATQHPAKLVA